jgi:peroxiredoxin
VGYESGVGREAPTFTLNAADGSEINLKQYRGDWFPVVVFVPTQMPDVERRLGQLSASADTLWGLRGQLLALCDASAEEVRALAEGVDGLSFPLLPDNGAVAQAYGALKKSGEVLPMAFIVDRAGKIVWAGEGESALKAGTLIAALRDVAR